MEHLKADRKIYSVVSLFSGAGGFDWGFHMAGRFKTLFACEILPEPASTLAHNLNLSIVKNKEHINTTLISKPILFQGDIKQVDFSKIKFQPDVLIGGPPCQDFSITISRKGGNRPGLNGGRGGLYVEFARAVMYLQPKVFAFENVPGLLSANDGNAIKTILNDLQNLEQMRVGTIASGMGQQVPSVPIQNYKIIFKNIIDAPKIGIPQTRRRLIIIGVRQDLFDTISIDEQEQIYRNLSQSLDGNNSLLIRFPLTCMEVFC